MGTGTFVAVGTSKPSQHSMKISILAKSVECWMLFVAGVMLFVVSETVFAMDGAVSL